MQEVRLLIIFIMLAICSIDDKYSKKVNVFVVFILGIIAYLAGKPYFFNMMFMQLIPGFMIYMLSKLKIGIGEADGIIFMILGICMDYDTVIKIMALSFIFAFIFSIFLFVKKKDKSYTFAFVPFIFISFCIVNMNNKYKTGSLTIELSMIMPGIMAMLILIIFTAYYLHDKCVIKKAAYIACLRETDEETEIYSESDVCDKFEHLTEKGLLGKWQLNKNVEIDDKKISMNISGNMISPAGLLDRYLEKPVFFINMDTYSYIKPEFCE